MLWNCKRQVENAWNDGKMLWRYERNWRLQLNDVRMYEEMQVVPFDTGDIRNYPTVAGLLSWCRNHKDIVDGGRGIFDFNGDILPFDDE